MQDSCSGKFQRCIVVDLDHTLVGVDTTALLAMKACGEMRRLLLRALSASFLRLIVLGLNRVLTRDIYKLLLLKTCIEHSEAHLDNAINEVYHEALKNLNPALAKIIPQVNEPKILLTASLDIIAKKFASLGFDLVISSISERGNGKIWCSIDLYQKKHIILRTLLKCCGEVIIIEDMPEPQYYTLNNVRVIRVAYHAKRP